MAQSFHNKILRVNLTERTVTIDEPGAIKMRRYMGGWNLIADVLLREVPAGTDALSAENVLVFAPGVLTGLAISGASRSAVGAVSPTTGTFGATEVGGGFGAQLKRAGFDALVVEGAAAEPVYLWIVDGTCEIRDATHLWGKTVKESEALVREEVSDARAELASCLGAREPMGREVLGVLQPAAVVPAHLLLQQPEAGRRIEHHAVAGRVVGAVQHPPGGGRDKNRSC